MLPEKYSQSVFTVPAGVSDWCREEPSVTIYQACPILLFGIWLV